MYHYSAPSAQTGKAGLDLKPPFWIALGIVPTGPLWVLVGTVIGLPPTVVVSFATGGIGWFIAKRARQSEQTRPWHWVLAGSGFFAVLLAILGLLAVRGGGVTDGDTFLATTIIFLLAGVGGGSVTVIAMLIAAVVQRSNPAAAERTPQGQMVAPIVGYSADGQPQYGPPIYMESRNSRTNVFAIAALVSSIFGGLPGALLGHFALNQIRQTGERGRGMAIAGIVLGYVFLMVWGVFVIGTVDSLS